MYKMQLVNAMFYVFLQLEMFSLTLRICDLLSNAHVSVSESQLFSATPRLLLFVLDVPQFCVSQLVAGPGETKYFISI